MTDATEQDDGQEPTMEEILASIRRIISDDEEEGEAKGDEEEVAEAEEEPAEAEDEAPEEVEEEDEILELTEVVENIDDVPDLEPELEPSMEDEVEDEEELVPVDDFDSIEVVEPEPELAPEMAPVPQPVAAASSPVSDLHALLSDHAADATAGTLSGLTGAVSAARDMPLGYAHQTLEDLVKSLLRPMLKEWLDKNLPALAERLVEKEIVKLVGRAENDQGP